MPFTETAGGTSPFVTGWGSGPRLVFTHAWGLRSDQWNYQVPALAEAGLRCVLYDRRGHGRSDRPATGYDIDTMADDLAAVIGHLGLHEATLVAHSLGAKEAIRYLTRHGDARIARLVLIAPTTPLLRRTADNPGGLDPALIDANYGCSRRGRPEMVHRLRGGRALLRLEPRGLAGPDRLDDQDDRGHASAWPVRQRPRHAPCRPARLFDIYVYLVAAAAGCGFGVIVNRTQRSGRSVHLTH